MEFFYFLSLAIRLYQPSFPAGPLDYILCSYRTIVDRFKPTVQHLHVRVKGFREERSYFSSVSCPSSLDGFRDGR